MYQLFPSESIFEDLLLCSGKTLHIGYNDCVVKSRFSPGFSQLKIGLAMILKNYTHILNRQKEFKLIRMRNKSISTLPSMFLSVCILNCVSDRLWTRNNWMKKVMLWDHCKSVELASFVFSGHFGFKIQCDSEFNLWYTCTCTQISTLLQSYW